MSDEQHTADSGQPPPRPVTSTASPLKAIAGCAVVAAVAVLVIVQWLGALQAANLAQRGVCLALDPEPINQPAKPFELPDASGRNRSLKQLAGKVVLLHFWFTRCPPCIEELPSLLHLQRTVGKLDPDFELVTVSVDEDGTAVERFLERHQLGSLPVLLDPNKRVSSAYGTEKFPESYLIAPDGTTRFRFVNKRNWASPLAQQCILSLRSSR